MPVYDQHDPYLDALAVKLRNDGFKRMVAKSNAMANETLQRGRARAAAETSSTHGGYSEVAPLHRPEWINFRLYCYRCQCWYDAIEHWRCPKSGMLRGKPGLLMIDIANTFIGCDKCNKTWPLEELPHCNRGHAQKYSSASVRGRQFGLFCHRCEDGYDPVEHWHCPQAGWLHRHPGVVRLDSVHSRLECDKCRKTWPLEKGPDRCNKGHAVKRSVIVMNG